MKCENCGQILEEKENYCPSCNKQIKFDESHNEIENKELKKDKKRFIITSILNYIAVLIAYAIIGYIKYLLKTTNEFTASVAGFVAFFWIMLFLVISFNLLIMSFISGIVVYKTKKNLMTIINLIILILLHLPFIIALLKITFKI